MKTQSGATSGKQANNGEPSPTSFNGRPPSRVAAAARGAIYLISGLRGTFCGSAAVMGGSGDECGRFVIAAAAIYCVKVGYWKYPINQQEECFGGSIVLHMHRIPLGIVGFEREGGEAVEL
jgi:hypothetical protein